MHPLTGLNIIILVWAIVLSVPEAMREAREREDKANIVPTPYFILIAFFWGLEGTTTIKYAYNCNYFLCVHVLDE